MTPVRGYSEMKDSGIEWVGKMPAHWNVSSIKREYLFQTGWTPNTKYEDFFEGNNIWANISDLKTKVVYDSAKHISDEAVKISSMNISPKGSLMYAFKLSVGAVSFCGTDMFTNEAIATFLPGKNSLEYLYYAAPIFIIKNANENIYGAKILNQQLIRNAKIIMPPLNEQSAIAAYLDEKCSKIDEIIASAKASIEDYKQWKASIIYEAVTKGLDPDAEMKDSGIEWIGKIPKGWKVSILSRYCTLQTGTTPSTSNREWFDGDLLWFTPGDFNDNYILEESNRKLSQLAKNDEVATIIPANTVLIVGIGATAGKVGFSVKECSCNQQITALSTFDLNSKYLMYWMISNQTVIKDITPFTTLPIINNRALGSFPVVIPSEKEQEEISNYLDIQCSNITKLILEKESLVKDLESYKKSLIYEVVTGKRKVC